MIKPGKPLPPFEAPRHGGRKNSERHERAQDFDRTTQNWTPSERVRIARLEKLNLKIEGERGTSDEYREAWDRMFAERKRRREAGLCPGCGGPGAKVDPNSPSLFSKATTTEDADLFVHEPGCTELEPKPYKVTSHGKKAPVLLDTLDLPKPPPMRPS